MLRVAYIAENEPAAAEAVAAPAQELSDFEKGMRRKIQKQTIKLYADKIRNIQEIYPGWMPEININNL